MSKLEYVVNKSCTWDEFERAVPFKLETVVLTSGFYRLVDKSTGIVGCRRCETRMLSNAEKS